MTGSFLRISLLAVFVALFGAPLLRARGVVARVQPPEVRVGQRLRFDLTFEDIDRIQYDPPQFPEGVQLLGQSQSSQVSIVNGRQTREVTLSFELRAVEVGKYEIPAVKILARQGKFSTAPVDLEVLPPPAREEGEEKDAGPLFLDVALSPKAVYMGEPISLWSRVYLKEGYRHARPPQGQEGRFEGFRVDQQEVDNKSGRWVTRPQGRFTEFDVDRKILVPLQEGEFTLLPGGAHVNVMRESDQFRRRAFMSSFFDPPSQQVRLEADGQVVKVFPIPRKGRPADYRGLVGRKLELSARIDETEVKVGTPVHLTLELEGRADLRGLKEIPLDFPPGVTVFETKGSCEIEWTPEGARSRAVFESVLVPNRPGRIQLPDISLSYFDAEKGVFARLQKPGISLQAQGQAAPPSVAVPAAASQVVREASVEEATEQRTLRFLHELPDGFPPRQAPLHARAGGLFWVGLLLVLGVASEAYGRHRERFAGDALGLRASQAYRSARASLAELAGRTPDREFYGEFAGILREYVAAKLRRETAGLRTDELRDLLGERGVPEDVVELGVDLLSQLEALRYSGAGQGNPDRERVLAQGWIDKLERSLA